MTNDTQTPPADAGRLDQPVRPVAWWNITDAGNIRCWSRTYAESLRLARQTGQQLEPLYDQAALDAAVAAERERCARICDTTPPQPFRPSIEAAHAIRNKKA